MESAASGLSRDAPEAVLMRVPPLVAVSLICEVLSACHSVPFAECVSSQDCPPCGTCNNGQCVAAACPLEVDGGAPMTDGGALDAALEDAGLLSMLRAE